MTRVSYESFTQTPQMHVERLFKLYTGLTCTYGLIRAARLDYGPVTGAAITIASPALWPFYALQDCMDWRLATVTEHDDWQSRTRAIARAQSK
jgi:hypothetical protein